MPTNLSPESLSAFWRWFAANEDDLFHFDRDREAIFDRLSDAMRQVDSDLTFEFSPIQDDGSREFVISAGGIQSAFPSVEALHLCAPVLTRWTFLPFRQRRSPLNDLNYGSHSVKAENVHYALFKDENPEKIGLMIFLDGYTEENRGTWGQIGFLFLDEALGEYDVESHVGEIIFADRQSEYFQHARPLSELPDHFDERLGRHHHSPQSTKG